MTDPAIGQDGFRGAGEAFSENHRSLTVSGRRWLPEEPAAPELPLIIALHGGTYSAAYFDLPGFSLLDRAAAQGLPIIALDRPCYGDTTALEPGTETIVNSAERLDGIIGNLRAASADPTRGIVLIGHSIGAAITLAIAARQPSWPLLGVAVSGLGLRSPPAAGAAWSALPETIMVDLPAELKDAVMFGPDDTFDAPMPGLGHRADAPVPRAELIDIVSGWPVIAGDLLARVRVPVHYRLGEFDRLWVTAADEVARFAAGLSAAPAIDAAMIHDVGHCIDFHRLGGIFQMEQLAFSLRCATATST